MSQKLTIMFVPVEGVGHVNACIGLAEVLLSRGHKIVFVTSKVYEGKLARYGFDEELIEEKNKEPDMKPGQKGADQLLNSGFLKPASSIEKMKMMGSAPFFEEMIDNTMENEPLMRQIVDKHKPDVIIIDHFIAGPSLIYSGIPWVFLFSGNPLFVLDDDRTPPGCSGFASNADKNSNEWKEFKELSQTIFSKYNLKYNKWLKENGFPTIDNNRTLPHSPYLNLYGYPKELDYTDLRPLPEKWFAVDSFIRKGEEEFVLPEQLKNRDEKNEKLIYLSLGSMGSGNVPLMKRLIDILSKSPHKFIVSKGVFGDTYELPDNMWGQNSVPQTKVLPLVDLVITHGGNNTVSETFSFGKPMIVMPLFGDQFDNAQRVHEKGFGIRMDASICSEEELLGAIEKLVNDNELKDRLKVASKRMANSESIVNASQLIENLVKN